MANGETIKLSFRTIITLIVATISLSGTYFGGILTAQEYAKTETKQVKEEITKKIDNIESDMKEIRKDMTDVKVQMARIEQMMVEQYKTARRRNE